jgi:hypothetical protein
MFEMVTFNTKWITLLWKYTYLNLMI